MKTAVLALLGFYKSALSPAIPSSCRFYPTCSAYAYEAVSQWGVRRGMWLALRRVARCRPFGGFGYDPVPSADNVRSS
ncbi:MAG TPA: membrane protein insertion efficiency factor YidD [Terriglobia bacterium]|nr:membrane protein insertion efficiency factor YidD [Terriglobia bacterium]